MAENDAAKDTPQGGGAKPAPPDGLPAPRRYWAAATVMTGISLSVLDTTIANVALPTIAVDLHASPAEAVWVVNAYNLAVVMTLLPLSALAERIGFRRMFTFGLMLFTLASLGCALAGTLWQLTAARVFQGVGAATLMCMFGGLVRNIYPLKMLGRGISINATTVAVMSVLGPTIGSAILSVAPWPWIFAVNLPICVLAMFGLRHLPEVPRNDVKLDWVSALLCMATLGVFISGVDMMGQDLLRGIGLVAIASVAGLVLVRRVSKQPAPLVPVDLLRIRPLAFAVGASACTFAAQMASYVSLPFYFQQVLGRPYLEVGMLMGAWPVGTAIIAPLAGRLSDRYSAATLSGVGAATMVAGMAVAGAAAVLGVQLAHRGGHVRGGGGLRLFPDAEQPRHAVGRAPLAQRRGRRLAGHHPGLRPELRHGVGGHRLQRQCGAWPRAGAGVGDGVRRPGGGRQHRPVQQTAGLGRFRPWLAAASIMAAGAWS